MTDVKTTKELRERIDRNSKNLKANGHSSSGARFLAERAKATIKKAEDCRCGNPSKTGKRT